MGRPMKYGSPEEAHAAHLQKKREYYARNKKEEQHKSSQRYQAMKAAGRPKTRRSPPSPPSSPPCPPKAPKIIAPAPATFVPKLRVAPNTKLEVLASTLWKCMWLGVTPPNNLQRAQEVRYAAIMELFERLDHDKAMSQLLRMIMDGQKLVDTADKARCEAVRRDPSHRAPQVAVMQRNFVEIETIHWVAVECEMYAKKGIACLAEAERKKMLSWLCCNI
ncbi:hypothetical protein M422DRAFT_247279 [Sphaerobolus stellatus SS14]|nr:hypothetical protein M422DRAFT_247279 [Sphaerobolus stellatus SS14]